MTKTRLAVLASGRGSNFRAVAQSCTKEDFPVEIAVLVTDKPRSGAVGIAEEFGIHWRHVDAGKKRGRLQPGSEQQVVDILKELDVDMVFLAGFMRILRGPLLEAFSGRIINVHPSLLPSFKGLDGQKQAFDYGAKVTGCSVHFVDDSVDGGPIILQSAVYVQEDDSVETLSERILAEEHRIASEAIKIVALGRYRIDGRRVILA